MLTTPMPSTPNRRQFLVSAAASAVCAGVMCSEALAGAAPAPTPGPVDVGTLADYAKDGVFTNFAQSRRLILTRIDGKLYALTSVCTHQGGILQEQTGQNGTNGVFRCPRHNAT